MLTKPECKILSVLLDLAADNFSNHGCNDLSDDITDALTKEEKLTLLKEYAAWDYDPDRFDGEPTANTLIASAQSAINGGYTGAGWEVLTPVDWGTQPGQQFLVKTPEGPAFELLFFGLSALGWMVWKKKTLISARS